MAASSGILQSYLSEALDAKKEFRFEELLARTYEKKGGDFLTPLSFYLDILGNTDKVMFPYMPKRKKDQLRHDLQVTCMLLLAQKQYEQDHQKTENHKTYDAQIKQCTQLLDALNPEYQAIIEKAPEQEYFTDGKPVKYCGIPLAHEFGEKLVELTDRKSKTLKDFLGSLNEKRLYWVWGSSFLKNILSSLPEDFFNSQQAGDTIKAPDPYTGSLSWGLYYFRFSLNLFLLLKHTIKGPWMSEVEARTPWYERFQTQWTQRKFTLLNDSIWGTANLLSFFWLNGKGVLGSWGDLLTLGLLVFDVSIALWDFAEQQTQYNQQMMQFDADIKKLIATRKQLLDELTDSAKKEEERKLKIYQIDMQINALRRAQAKCKREWELQKLGLYNNMGYAIGLTLAFVVLTMPFIPIPAATAMTLGVVGAVLCFAFTVISNAIRGGIAIYKEYESLKEAKQEFQERVNLFKKRLRENPDLSDNEKKFLFLEIKKFDAKTQYQKQMVNLQIATLIRSLIIETLLPAVIFATLVFLPLGVGFGALGGVLGLAIASHFLINALFRPDEQMKELPPFNHKEYKAFCTLMGRESNPKAQHAFFQQHEDTSSASTPEEISLDDLLFREGGLEL